MINIERLHPTLTRAMLIAAATACGFACLAHLSSYGPSTWSGTVQAAALGAFGLIFPVFGSAVVVLSLGRIPPGQLFATLPVWLAVFSVCVVAYVVVDFLLRGGFAAPSHRLRASQWMDGAFTHLPRGG